jgi:hypothetical protein
MYTKLLVQIHKFDETELVMVNKSGTIIAPKGCETAIMKNVGRGDKTQHLSLGALQSSCVSFSVRVPRKYFRKDPIRN